MKFNPKQISAFLKKPDPNIRAVLVYGEDRGLVEERVKSLTETVVGDINDPFRVSLLTSGQIEKDPACLTDEATALSLTGGERVVVVELDGSDPSKALKSFLENSPSGSLIIIKAAELKTSSPLRKLIEKNKQTASMPTYNENSASIRSFIASFLRENNIQPDQSSMQYLINNLGSDRHVTRSELEKLVIFLGKKKTLQIDDATSIIGDNAKFSIDQVVYATANGNSAELDRKLNQALNEGHVPVRILRAAITHYKKLYTATAHINAGQTQNEALNAVKPPIIFFLKTQFIRQLNNWNQKKIEDALSLLFRAEAECKKTNFPDKAICGRALISLARAGRRTA